LSTTFGDYFRIFYVLPLVEMIVMYDETKARVPQFCG
jgi:hypothetical protein